MFKKILILIIVVVGMMSSQVFADDVYHILDETDTGVVIVTYPIESDTRYKVMLEKDDKSYYYDLTTNHARLPLQMGAGLYKLVVLKNVEGISYSYEYEAEFEVLHIDEEALYLNSHVTVNWHDENNAVVYLDELLQASMTDEQIVSTVHGYLTESLSYDFDKFDKIKGAYLPDIDETFESNLGICYDFSSLFAAMLRSQGVETKLVMGYRSDTTVYHAWNEVNLNGAWLIVDLTLDVEYYEKAFAYSLFKDDMFYDKSEEY